MSGAATRISVVRVLILLMGLVLVAGTIRWFATRGLQRPADPVSPAFAGYVDVTATPAYAFESPADAPQSHVVLSFIVAATDQPCTPTWGTYYTLQTADSDLDLDRRIAQLRDVGGTVSVSFGGQINSELAAACTDLGALRQAYQAVIDKYALQRIDFDLEGPALTDLPSQQRRAETVAALQREAEEADRTLQVWVTLPVDTNGLTSAGVSAVQTLTDAGVTLSGVNGMAMNFAGSKPATQPMGVAVQSAGDALVGQVRSLLPDASWQQVGLTVMIGQNDVPSEVFTLEDAQAVNDYSLRHGVGWLSMWSLNRDQTCPPPLPKTVEIVQTNCSGVNQQGRSYAEILAAGAAGDVPGAPDPAVTPAPEQEVVDDPTTSPYPIWDPQGTYPGGTRVVFKRRVYRARFWTTGIAPASVSVGSEDPWTLIGPVLPGDTPAPLPTLPAGTYPQWKTDEVYTAGDRVQVGGVGYEAKWWTKDQRPGEPVAGGSAWTLIIPGSDR